jgi:hypothetical protein
MTMIAYLDESGTHGASAATQVLGGFIASEQGWMAYEGGLESLFKQHNVEYFHAIKFRNRKGPFKHFNEATQAIFIHDFYELVDRHLAYGFAVSLAQQVFLEIYRANKEGLPKRFRYDSQYGICFRFCMSAIRTFMLSHPDECPITVVLEGGHRNCGDAVRIYNDAKEELQRRENDTTFGHMVVELKKSSLPLAAALCRWQRLMHWFTAYSDQRAPEFRYQEPSEAQESRWTLSCLDTVLVESPGKRASSTL